ncbi:hypothetical protein CAPTEDRAFT_215339, partial [Capitella teleta]
MAFGRNGIRVSDAVSIPIRGKLKCSYITYAVGPVFKNDEEACEKTLQETFYNVLVQANDKLNVRSVGFPPIGTGSNGIPLDVCARSFIKALLEFSSQRQQRHLQSVSMINFDPEATALFIIIIGQLLDNTSRGQNDNFLNSIEGHSSMSDIDDIKPDDHLIQARGEHPRDISYDNKGDELGEEDSETEEVKQDEKIEANSTTDREPNEDIVSLRVVREISSQRGTKYFEMPQESNPFTVFTVNNLKMVIKTGNITNEDVDVIVCPSTNDLRISPSFGIKEAGGKEHVDLVYATLLRSGKVFNVSDAVSIPIRGKLKCSYITYAVGPVFKNDEEA